MSSSLFKAMSNSNFLINGLMNNLRGSNPNAYNQLQLLLKGNQEQAIMDLLTKANPQQINQLKTMAHQFGVSDTDLSKYVK